MKTHSPYFGLILFLGIFSLFLFPSVSRDFGTSVQAASPEENEETNAALPESWVAAWSNPPVEMRPLQIVHGRDITSPEDASYYRDQCGLGGLVVNVGGAGYIRSDENWKRFVETVRNIRAAGMRVWIYDEEGYPSLSAGGVVMEGHPELCSQELVYDAQGQDDQKFQIRDSFEFTHSSNNYCAVRRYPNPLNLAATERFLDVTHRRYRQELGDELYHQVEAFFTDEPSMMAVNLGEIPAQMRQNVRTVDPLDPEKKNLPMVSWTDDLEERYQEKYGEALRPDFLSLFQGETDRDRQVRRQFWQLLGELNVQRFYQTIQDFCHSDPQGPVASGHTLWEEDIANHVPLDGNKLATLKAFDIPGLDLLSSNPMIYYYGPWVTAALPCSAATLTGQRKVMTEVSDFSEIHGTEAKPADLTMMQAAAAWQAAVGVTEFALYYGIHGGENAPYRQEESHRLYCEFVGRLNSLLREATPVRPVLLFYPIEEIQEEFLPSAEKIDFRHQSSRLQEIHDSFHQIGAALGRAHIPFTLIDRASLATLQQGGPEMPRNANSHQISPERFSGIIFPRGTTPETFAWKNAAFKEIWASEEQPLVQPEEIARVVETFAGPHFVFEPANTDLICGVFERDGHTIFLVVNPTKEKWEGTARVSGGTPSNKDWRVLDPQVGSIDNVTPKFDENSQESLLPVSLAPCQTLLWVAP